VQAYGAADLVEELVGYNNSSLEQVWHDEQENWRHSKFPRKNELYASNEGEEDPPWLYALERERRNQSCTSRPSSDDQWKWCLHELLNSLSVHCFISALYFCLYYTKLFQQSTSEPKIVGWNYFPFCAIFTRHS
jgi:hypothetical protein